jgi:hypothetical protein
MNTLPLWIQVLQALLTPTIAIGVAVVAFMQWHTAHQRFVLDLFERRMEVYEQVRRVVARVNSSGQADAEAEIELLSAIEKASFLFGRDVTIYLDNMRLQLILLFDAQASKNGANLARRTALFQSIKKFYYDGPALFRRYMRMPHKSRRSPIELFSDKCR